MKQCRICKHFKPVTSFFKNGYRKIDGTSSVRNECKSCSKKVHDRYVDKNKDQLNAYMRRRYNIKEKIRIREYGLKRMYNLTIDQYNYLLKTQNDKCAICEYKAEPLKRPLDVDHCHQTGKIRGLLCMRCNRALGLFKDNSSILLNAASYLQK